MTQNLRISSPGRKLAFAILIGLILSVPLFSVWLLVYDRESQFAEARNSITQGWGGKQDISGPRLVVPYRVMETRVVEGSNVTQQVEVEKLLTLEAEAVDIKSEIDPEIRRRSIYEAVVYDARARGSARFAFPTDLGRYGVDQASLDLTRAELRFGLSDPRGLGANPSVKLDEQAVRLQPGAGSGPGTGFFAFVDATPLASRAMTVAFDFTFRGNSSIMLSPHAGDTKWSVTSSWPHPSFTGAFLPGDRSIAAGGFTASYRIGNLALGRSLLSTGEAEKPGPQTSYSDRDEISGEIQPNWAAISLVQPVDLYSQVDRATKYGFLFIGFTFMALLMFDIIAGARVSPVEYLLMGAALVLFFVLLLAFAEVAGFALAYVAASASIAGLNTAYAAAILKSWKRGILIGCLLVGLYAVLYVLLSLEAYSLLIGSLLVFAALAGIMFATRKIDWGQAAGQPAPRE